MIWCLISVRVWNWRVFLASLSFSFPALIIVVLGFTSGAVSLPTREEEFFLYIIPSRFTHSLSFTACGGTSEGTRLTPSPGPQWIYVFIWERFIHQSESACYPCLSLPRFSLGNSSIQTIGKGEFEQSLQVSLCCSTQKGHTFPFKAKSPLASSGHHSAGLTT